MASMWGERTAELIESVHDEGVSRMAVLMRHSAREFEPGRHDLLNPLTDEGRTAAQRLGERLPKALRVRGYASPPERCMETAEKVMVGHSAGGGEATRHRPVEALGVFYALDQMKMWKGMRGAGGLPEYLRLWFSGAVPTDAMMPPDLAARLVFEVVASKLADAPGASQLDLCVSHDMTLMLVMDRLLGQRAGDFDVEFLDGLVAYESDDRFWLRSCHGPALPVERIEDGSTRAAPPLE